MDNNNKNSIDFYIHTLNELKNENLITDDEYNLSLSYLSDLDKTIKNNTAA